MTQQNGYTETNLYSDANPFLHHVSLTPKQWLTTLVFGAVLVPIRCGLLALLIMTVWLPCLLVQTVFLSSDAPMSTFEDKLFMWFCRIASYIVGIRYTVENGENYCNKSNVIHISTPHCSIFEMFLFGFDYRYTTLSKVEVKNWYILGTFFKRMGNGDSMIFVDKNDKDSRRQAHEAISNWLERSNQQQDDKDTKYLCMAPEGWYANGKVLLPFKTGAFKPGLPVQTTYIIWDKDFNPTVTTWGSNVSWFGAQMLTLAQPWTNVTVKISSVYYPNEEEKLDAELYAKNVNEIAAKELGMPICKHSALDMLRQIKAIPRKDKGA